MCGGSPSRVAIAPLLACADCALLACAKIAAFALFSSDQPGCLCRRCSRLESRPSVLYNLYYTLLSFALSQPSLPSYTHPPTPDNPTPHPRRPQGNHSQGQSRQHPQPPPDPRPIPPTLGRGVLSPPADVIRLGRNRWRCGGRREILQAPGEIYLGMPPHTPTTWRPFLVL